MLSKRREKQRLGSDMQKQTLYRPDPVACASYAEVTKRFKIGDILQTVEGSVGIVLEIPLREWTPILSVPGLYVCFTLCRNNNFLNYKNYRQVLPIPEDAVLFGTFYDKESRAIFLQQNLVYTGSF